MNYLMWLAILGVAFTILERLFPRAASRPLHWADAVHIGMNSYAFPYFASQLFRYQFPTTELAWGFWMQFVVIMLYCDIAQYGIHNLMHRVPFLWHFHRVHHSAPELNWMVNWRFHYGEALVYRTLLYLPAAWIGFSGDAVMAHAVIGTAMGHLSHANVRWNFGPLRYLINTPRMHLWHHSVAPVNKNFGMVFAVWDWLFGTAYLPERDPAQLGMADDPAYPQSWAGQFLRPFTVARRAVSSRS